MNRPVPNGAENALPATEEAWKEDVEAEVLACRGQRRGLGKLARADSAAQGGRRVTAAQGLGEDSAVPVAEWLIAPAAVSSVQEIPEADFSDPVAMDLAQDWAAGRADWAAGTQAPQIAPV